MSYYHTCPHCRANLDPGERCDCREDEKTLASAANAGEGMVEQTLTRSVSASNDTRNHI